MCIFSATPTSTLTRHSGNNSIQDQQQLATRTITYQPPSQPQSSSQDIASVAVASSTRDIQCTLQNCDLNTNNCSLIRSSSSLSNGGLGGHGGPNQAGCYSAPSTMKNNQQNQTSTQNLAQILASNQSTQNLYEQYIDCMGSGATSTTILPPPLFDNGCTGNYNQCYELQTNYCNMSQTLDLPKTPSGSSKRLHRTIPKHFTMSSPSSSAALICDSMSQQHSQHSQQTHSNNSGNNGSHMNNNNKKPACQCPVQHVPTTYMTSTQFSNQPQQGQSNHQQAQVQAPIQTQQTNQSTNPTSYSHQSQRHQQHSVYLSSSSKKNNVIKSTTFPSAMNVSASTVAKMSSAEIVNCDVINHPEITGGGTLRRSHKSSSSSHGNSNIAGQMIPTTPNKKSISTISAVTVAPSSSAPYLSAGNQQKHNNPHQQQIHSILKNKNQGNACHSMAIDASEQNPILPPKMYKNTSKYPGHSSGSNAGGAQLNPKIHTITRPNDLTNSSHFSLLSINGGGNGKHSTAHQPQYQQPTQLRTNIQVRFLEF